ncbi:MAG: copper-binding protein [Hyphomicrobiaceae bacterium]|nr:copper-binding protein [Hyphomicrobiaceae bacterium]
MMSRRKFFAAAALLAMAALAGVGGAAAQSEMVEGEIRKVDESAGKITIKHGPIKKFDMDSGMTMVFRASDPAMLKQVKPGDKIRFEADKVNGQFTLMRIEKQN